MYTPNDTLPHRGGRLIYAEDCIKCFTALPSLRVFGRQHTNSKRELSSRLSQQSPLRQIVCIINPPLSQIVCIALTPIRAIWDDKPTGQELMRPQNCLASSFSPLWYSLSTGRGALAILSKCRAGYRLDTNMEWSWALQQLSIHNTIIPFRKPSRRVWLPVRHVPRGRWMV